jgi:hypothetical protein
VWEEIATIMSGRIVTLEPLTREHANGLRTAAADERTWQFMATTDAERLGCLRVEFKTDALNDRARAALPARFEGIHRKHMVVRGGERRDSAWYAVIDDDWPEVKAALERRLAHVLET